MGNVQVTLGHSLCSKSLCTPTGCLVSKMVPREGPASLEPGQRLPPPAPTVPAGLRDPKTSHRRGCFSKTRKWKIAEG